MKPRRMRANTADMQDAHRVTVTDDDLLAKVVAHGLNVRGVLRAEGGSLTVVWRSHPTEAEQAFAQELLGERVGHAT